MRFVVVSVVALVANLVILRVLVGFGVDKVLAQAIAIVARDAAQLRRQQALELRALAARYGAARLTRCAASPSCSRSSSRWRAPLTRRTQPIAPVYDAKGRIIETPLAPTEQPTRLTPDRARRRSSSPTRRCKRLAVALPEEGPHDRRREFKPDTRSWQVNVWWDKAGEIATGRVDDATAHVTEAWTGPQVAWGMARGSPGAFGGKKLNSYSVWLALLRASSCSGSSTGAGRSRCARSTSSRCSRSPCRCGSSTAATSSRARRSPIRRSCT